MLVMMAFKNLREGMKNVAVNLNLLTDTIYGLCMFVNVKEIQNVNISYR